MLIQWLCSTFDGDHYLAGILTQHDYLIMAAQFCTHLLAAGIMKRVEDEGKVAQVTFKVSMRERSHR